MFDKIAEKRVKLGVEFLNNERPGWYNDICTDTLNIGLTDFCILGQLHDFKSYTDFDDFIYENEIDAVGCGFDINDLDGVLYKHLETAWINAITDILSKE